MDRDDRTPPDLSGPRRSKSAEAARAAELARIIAMTPRQRMAVALGLGRRRLALERLRERGGQP
jgi:hypothetical protein